MSQSQVIYKFLQKNNDKREIKPTYEEMTESNWSIKVSDGRPSRKAKKSLNSQFPFNRCDIDSLIDSKSSINIGLKLAIKDYKDFSIRIFKNIDSMLDVYGDTPDSSRKYKNDDSEEEDEVSFTETLSLLLHESISPVPSSILSSNECQSHSNLELLKEKITDLIKIRFFEAKNDKDFKEIVNFTANGFFQDIDGFNLTAVCDEIILKISQGSLDEELDSLFLEHYNDIKLYSFFDYTSSCLSDDLSELSDQTSDNPRIYDKYFDIWKLNPDDYDLFDYECLINEAKARYHLSPLDLIQKYSEIGLLMNFVKFYTYFGRQVNNFEHTNYKEFHISNYHERNVKSSKKEQQELKRTIEEILSNPETLVPRTLPSPKSKFLRFSDENTKIEFYRWEPPSYVQMDVIEMEATG